MAKGYRTKHDVAFPVVIAKVSDDDYATEGRNYPAGSIVHYETLPPHVQKRVDSGELDDTLEPMEDDEFESEQSYTQADPEFGIFVAEHEAEAHALREAGHHVIPKDQALESMSSGQGWARQYQDAVRERGLDRRPMQEEMAKAEGPEGRVPDHLLHGLETRSGTPHNRGPVHQQRDDEEYEDDEGQDESESEEPASRPRPPGETETQLQENQQQQQQRQENQQQQGQE